MAEKLEMMSSNIIQENIDYIAEKFPNALKEVMENGKLVKKIDFDVLKQELSTVVIDDKQERYQMTWPDKKKSILLANSRTNNILRPFNSESIEFESTKNLYIEGDNLEVLKIIRETYLGKIRMIYIDPPYNTGADFVYSDKFNQSEDEYLNSSGHYDEYGNRLFQNTDSSGKFHTNWLNMIYTRLKLAKDLLSDDGIIYISIDDNEVDNLKKICTEIFGERNFLGCAGRITKKSNNKGDHWAPNFDYILTFAKNIDSSHPFTGGANIDAYNLVEEEGPRKGEKYQLVRLYMSSIKNRNPEQRFWIECPDGSKIIPPGSTFPPERPNLGDGIWRWTRKKYEAEKDRIVIKKVSSSNLLDENRQPAKWNVFTKTYLNDVLDNSSAKPNSFIEGHINQIASHELGKLGIPFDYAKPTTLIKYLLAVTQIKENDIVLDFFSGSSSTADAVMQYNYENKFNVRFIMVQLDEMIDQKEKAYKFLQSLNKPEKITELGKERIKRAGKKIKEEAGILDQDLDFGFRVLKLDSSNMNDVFYNPNLLNQNMLDQLVGNVKEDRTPLDLLFQVMLELGIELSAKIEEKKLLGKKYFVVNENDIVACFDDGINDELVKELAKIKSIYAVFKDSAFTTDSANINCEQIFKSISPSTTIKVI